ncbi:MAG: type II secretion system F family protein [bacterium]|nr:type II secretion system F family protein [bacterium]
MPTYWYKALGAGGAQLEGTVDAASRREALQRLLDGGKNPVDLREQAQKPAVQSTSFSLRRRAIRLATFTRQLATLSSAGVPIVRGLNVLIDQQEEPRAKQLLTDIKESVQGGSTFADALAKHPKDFPPLMSSMVSVGEHGGTLDEQLLELSTLYEREEALRGEVMAAAAYPVLVLLAGVVSAIILVAFFIPRLEVMFEGAGQDLPAPTRVLLAISHFTTDYRWYLVIGMGVLAVAGRFAMRDPGVRMALDGAKLRVPWLGTLLRNVAVARLTRLLGTLTRGGISIVDALALVRPAIGNRVISATIADMTARVRTGESLAALMGEAHVFPPLSVQMVSVGEETGKLDHMLLRVAEAYDRETMTSTKVMTSLLAPALILFVAGIVGFILISMLLPIFQLSSVMR